MSLPNKPRSPIIIGKAPFAVWQDDQASSGGSEQRIFRKVMLEALKGHQFSIEDEHRSYHMFYRLPALILSFRRYFSNLHFRFIILFKT